MLDDSARPCGVNTDRRVGRHEVGNVTMVCQGQHKRTVQTATDRTTAYVAHSARTAFPATAMPAS
jgi:hypothetical protein